jgi:PAS domain S-box-containing protein
MKNQRILYQEIQSPLIQSEQFLFITTDRKGNINFCNRAFLKQFSFLFENYFGKPFSHFLYEEDVAKFIAASEYCFYHPGKNTSLPLRIIAGDTDFISTKWEFCTQFDETGNVTGLQGIGISIAVTTDAHLLSDFAKELKAYLNVFRDALVIADKHKRIVRTNKKFCELTGTISYEISGSGLPHIIPADLPELMEILQQKKVYEEEMVREVHCSARNQWFKLQSFQNSFGTLIILTDITVQKQMLEALQRSEHLNNILINHTEESLILLDKDFTVQAFNRNAQERYFLMSGKQLREGADFLEYIIHEDRIEPFKQAASKALAGEKTEFEKDFVLLDGNAVVYHITYKPLYDESKAIIGFGLTARDVTAKAQAEKKILQNEERFRNLFANSIDAIFICDAGCNIIYAASSVENVLGYTQEEIIGMNGLAFVHPEDVQLAQDLFMKEVSGEAGLNSIDIRIKKKDGDWLWAEAKGKNMLDNPAINGVILNLNDIKERKKAELKLKEVAERMNLILESINEGMFLVDEKWVIRYVNHAAEKILTVSRNDLMGKNIWEIYADAADTAFYKQFQKAVNENKAVQFVEYCPAMDIWFDISAYPSSLGLIIYFRNVNARKKKEMEETLEKETLSLYAASSRSLKECIDHYMHGLEKIYPTWICSVLLKEENSDELYFFSSGSIPADVLKAAGKIPIGPVNGSCGTAAFLKKPVIVDDLNSSPLWNSYKHLVQPLGWQSSWSFPLFSTGGEILGSFAVYSRQIKQPNAEEIGLCERTCNLLKLLVENKQAEEKIRINNERYYYATKATNEAVWDMDVKTGAIRWSENFFLLFGYSAEHDSGNPNSWHKYIHPDDRARILNSLKEFLGQKKNNRWEAEYRFRKANGNYAYISDKGYLLFDENKEPCRMVGSMEDITTRKLLHEQLLKQELSKQKMVIEATINAQEKERAEIGKELHDNINQLLSTTKLYLDVAKTDKGKTDEMIQLGRESLLFAINEIRSISHSLVPPGLKDIGIISSIQDLLNNLSVTTSLKISYTHIGDEIESLLTQNQKLTLYRILQEQMNNIIKHAGAENVKVELLCNKRMVRLLASDDGKGFDVKKVKKGIGINNIINRAEANCGRVVLRSAEGKGCTLMVYLQVNT